MYCLYIWFGWEEWLLFHHNGQVSIAFKWKLKSVNTLNNLLLVQLKTLIIIHLPYSIHFIYCSHLWGINFKPFWYVFSIFTEHHCFLLNSYSKTTVCSRAPRYCGEGETGTALKGTLLHMPVRSTLLRRLEDLNINCGQHYNRQQRLVLLSRSVYNTEGGGGFEWCYSPV